MIIPLMGLPILAGTLMMANNRRYAGILSNTNMGAPLTPTVGRSIWQGFISSGEGIISEVRILLPHRPRLI